MHPSLNAFEYTPGPRTHLAWVVYGLWVRAVVVGFAAFATGIVMMSNGSETPMAGIAAIVGGALIATFSWRRAGTALDRLTALEPEDSTPVVRQSRNAGMRAPIGLSQGAAVE